MCPLYLTVIWLILTDFYNFYITLIVNDICNHGKTAYMTSNVCIRYWQNIEKNYTLAVLHKNKQSI